MGIPIWAIFALVSALFFAGRDIIVKKTLSKNYLNVTENMFLEFSIAIIALLGFFFSQIEFHAIPKYWYLFLFKAATVGGATYMHYSLLKKHSISHVSPFLNLSPLVLLVLTSVVLSEVMTTIQLVGIGITVAGTFYLESSHLNKKALLKDKNFYGFILLFLIVISFAAIADRLLLAKVSVVTNFAVTSILLLIFVIPKTNIKKTLKVVHKHPYVVMAFILGNVSSAFVLAAIGHPEAIVAIIIPLRRTSTLFSSLFGGLLFHEDHLAKKALATAIMIVGVFLMVQ